MKIKRDDRVILLKDITFTAYDTEAEHLPRSKKGDVSRVLKVVRKTGKVIVEGVNLRKKAVRPTQDSPRGGFILKEMPIDVSNIALHKEE
mgnify:CR=1 FL=1|tara:strand:+ start:187 stop:456 length:270 start_codon:yes stop_codon:yes gene_type:complete